MSKEESVTIKIIKAFSNEKILLQHHVLNYQIDLYFPEHKLAVEVDEKGHTDRDEKKKKENESEEQIKKELGCIFIRINPDAENYIFIQISKIQLYIAQSNKEKLEKEKEAEIKELKEKLKKEKKTKIKELKEKLEKEKGSEIKEVREKLKKEKETKIKEKKNQKKKRKPK